MMENEQYIPEGAEPALGSPEQAQAPTPEVTPEANPQQAVQPENTFDPKAFEYKYKGQAFTPKDRNHLTNLMAKGHSYEASMAAIKEEKQQINQMRDRYKPYEQMDQLFKTNQQFKTDVMSAYQRHQQGQAQQPQNIPPEIQSKLEAFEQFQNQFTQSQADQKLDGQIKSVREKHSNFDWNTDDGEGNLETKVLRFMDDSNILDFEKGFRAYAFDLAQENAKVQGIQQHANAQVQKRKAGTVDPGTPSVPASPRPPPNYGKQSYKDLASQAKRDLGI